MNIEIRARLDPWEFQQIVGGLDFPNLHRCCQSETQASFKILFKALVYAIRMDFNKIVLRLTDDR